MKTLKVILALVFLPFYATAYALAKVLRMKGYEDMPSLSELFEMV